MRYAITIILCLYLGTNLSAQLYDEYTDEEIVIDDFTFDGVDQDSIIKVDNSSDPSGFKAIFSGKPGKAAMYSLMVPGWGQIYNGKIWKVPLVIALEGTAIYYLIQNRSKYNDFNACYISLASDMGEIEECSGINNVGTAFTIRQGYRKNKELSYVFVLGAHLFQAFEAFIDRHLVDFDLDEDLSFHPFVKPHFTSNEIHLAGIYLNLSPNKKQEKPKSFH